MSSAAYITLEEGSISLEEFLEFALEHDISYSPNTVGQNVFYHGQVEVTFGEGNYENKLPQLANGRYDFSKASPLSTATSVTFSTYFMGEARPDVARLALLFWQRFGGNLSAADEIRSLFSRAQA